jgi:hypothetical protein
LWRNDCVFGAFVADGCFQVVTDSFGRPTIDIQMVLDACKGRASTARFARLNSVDIQADADLDLTLAQETAHNRDVAMRPGVVGQSASIRRAGG